MHDAPMNTLPALARFAGAVMLAATLSGGLAACSTSIDTRLSGAASLQTAKVALANGSNDLALNICTGLLLKDDNDADLLVCRGDALSGLGRNAEAIAAYEQAMTANARSVAARIGLGRVALRTDPARAEALFLEALTNDPRNATALNNLGIARDLQGRHAQAQTAYGEAIAAAPEMRAPQVNLALSFAMSGRGAEAVRIMRPIAARPDATEKERHDMAAVLAMAGQPEEASRLLRGELDGTQADEAVSGYRSLQRN